MDVTAVKPDGIFFAMGRSRSRVHDKSNDLEGIALLLGVSNEVLTRSGMLKNGPWYAGPWIRFHGTLGSHGLDGCEAYGMFFALRSSRSRVHDFW